VVTRHQIIRILWQEYMTYAASQPNVCNAPCFSAHGTWKYATLKPPSTRARFSRALISPWCFGKQSFVYASKAKSLYILTEETNVNGLTDRYGVHHDRDLGYAPSQHERPNRKVLLKCCAEDDEAGDVQRHSYVACPVKYPYPPSSYFNRSKMTR
jgi:hypothetical protein